MSEIDDKIKEAGIGQEYKLSNRMWEKFDQTPFSVEPKTDQEKAYWDKVSKLKEKALTQEDIWNRFVNCYAITLGVPDKLSTEDFISITEADQTLVRLLYNMAEWYYKGDHKGGLLISSAPGVGKTNAVKALCLMSNIFGSAKTGGEFYYHDVSLMISSFLNGNKEDLTFYRPENLVIDDLSERLNGVNTFGFKFSLDLVFENRYNAWKSHGKRTIITTNILPDRADGIISLEDLLTERSLDRIREQYHVISLDSNSKRKS